LGQYSQPACQKKNGEIIISLKPFTAKGCREFRIGLFPAQLNDFFPIFWDFSEILGVGCQRYEV
jgi:hypothetical protein